MPLLRKHGTAAAPNFLGPDATVSGEFEGSRLASYSNRLALGAIAVNDGARLAFTNAMVRVANGGLPVDTEPITQNTRVAKVIETVSGPAAKAVGLIAENRGNQAIALMGVAAAGYLAVRYAPGAVEKTGALLSNQSYDDAVSPVLPTAKGSETSEASPATATDETTPAPEPLMQPELPLEEHSGDDLRDVA